MILSKRSKNMLTSKPGTDVVFQEFDVVPDLVHGIGSEKYAVRASFLQPRGFFGQILTSFFPKISPHKALNIGKVDAGNEHLSDMMPAFGLVDLLIDQLIILRSSSRTHAAKNPDGGKRFDVHG